MNKEFDNDLLTKFGKKYVAGYDETGRGACAYTFVAACCILKDDYYNPDINDSKQLTEAKRFELEEEIKENSVFWNIVEFDNKQIDNLGIQKINILSFEKLRDSITLDSVIHVIDGDIMKNEPWCISIIKGDRKSFAVACASIIAKCYRDRDVTKLSEKYPLYNLAHNKGYGQEYIKLVKEHGIPVEIHRNSYNINKGKQIKLF